MLQMMVGYPMLARTCPLEAVMQAVRDCAKHDAEVFPEHDVFVAVIVEGPAQTVGTADSFSDNDLYIYERDYVDPDYLDERDEAYFKSLGGPDRRAAYKSKASILNAVSVRFSAHLRESDYAIPDFVITTSIERLFAGAAIRLGV